MPAYDVSLWDFLKYASTQNQGDLKEEFFPLSERFEMSKRICDGLLHMNRDKSVAHRDIKLRPGLQIKFIWRAASVLKSLLKNVPSFCLKAI